jgi:hypothetical protein
MDKKNESLGNSSSKVRDLADEISSLAELVGAKFVLDKNKFEKFRSFDFDREANELCHN